MLLDSVFWDEAVLYGVQRPRSFRAGSTHFQIFVAPSAMGTVSVPIQHRRVKLAVWKLFWTSFISLNIFKTTVQIKQTILRLKEDSRPLLTTLRNILARMRHFSIACPGHETPCVVRSLQLRLWVKGTLTLLGPPQARVAAWWFFPTESGLWNHSTLINWRFDSSFGDHPQFWWSSCNSANAAWRGRGI